MLSDKDFAELGRPSEARIFHLPRWAQRYELELRLLASWWHDARRGRPARHLPSLKHQPDERLMKLPVWAFEWINDLRFEVYWQRSQVKPDEPTSQPVRQVSRSQPSSANEFGSTVS